MSVTGDNASETETYISVKDDAELAKERNKLRKIKKRETRDNQRDLLFVYGIVCLSFKTQLYFISYSIKIYIYNICMYK